MGTMGPAVRNTTVVIEVRDGVVTPKLPLAPNVALEIWDYDVGAYPDLMACGATPADIKKHYVRRRFAGAKLLDTAVVRSKSV